MVPFDCDRAAHNLPVQAGVGLERSMVSPRLQVEQLTKEWKRLGLIQYAKADDGSQLRFKDAGGFAKPGKTPGVCRFRILGLAMK